ncbi:MAG: hypothetical protein M1331_00620, partial [Candidatus Marsarchaeota archaeon]|nr:hypothetical protein [Candidatus Marsarchaeota archaeon]
LLNYYKLNKDTEKEKNTAKKIITAYLDIADKSLENEEKIKNSSNVELAKKAVLAIIDGIEISEKYGFDRIAEKLYKKSIAICYSKGMYKYAEEIEQKRVKNAGKKYGNAESKSYF